MSSGITHIDCFSGPGGICTGFRAAGIKTILAIEKVQSCVDTYQANHNDVHVICKDIREVTEKDIASFIPPQGIDILSSGMPCETFSTAGSKSRAKYDDRQSLFIESIRIAKIVRARFILFENVPAIKTKKVSRNGSKKRVIDDLFEKLKEEGYTNYHDFTLNSADYGVPQLRERYFILASRYQMPLYGPTPTCSKYVTVKEALYNLPNVEVNSKTPVTTLLKVDNQYTRLMRNKKFWKLDHYPTEISQHFPPNHRAPTLERFSMIKQGEGLKDLFDKLSDSEKKELQKRKVLSKRWYIQRNRRLIPDKPSHTITSHCIDETIHPFHDRALTVREIARLQSFPDFYDFAGGPYLIPHFSHEQDKYEQIGDAVPPLVAYAWGKVLCQLFSDRKDGRYKDYCQSTYKKIYEEQFNTKLGQKTGSKSKSTQKEIERMAQKEAIKNTFIEALVEYGTYEPVILWKAIYAAHLQRKVPKIDMNNIDEDIITNVISADQSWKKASGHAFASFICELLNPKLEGYNIRLVLQKDLNEMINNKEIFNDETDIAWIQSKTFDLYAVLVHNNKSYVFGCVQSRTSIRERVKGDSESSKQAMDAAFWSIAIVLDGSFLTNPKFKEMVNGGSSDSGINGWHGMYVLSDKYKGGRIYPIGAQYKCLVDHTRKASESWISARNRFTNSWKAE